MIGAARARCGILLVNLGSPQAPTRREVRRFLREFLLDSRVVELPRPLWWPLLNGLIIPLRAGRVARAYAAIWGPAGSPLRGYTRGLAEKLQDELTGAAVRWAVTYGDPGIARGLQELQAAGAETLLVIPLFPQYSATTTASVYDRIADIVKQTRNIPDLRLIRDYADHPAYISALADSVRTHWRDQGRGDRLLMSFHGIPQRCADLGDPYPDRCRATAQLLAEALQLDTGQWQIAYQSRFGRQQWLQPYTDQILLQWAREGISRVDVICPAFAADCLETLEEIGEQNAERFRGAGGNSLRLIPCLNDSDRHVAAMRALIGQYLPEISA